MDFSFEELGLIIFAFTLLGLLSWTIALTLLVRFGFRQDTNRALPPMERRVFLSGMVLYALSMFVPWFLIFLAVSPNPEARHLFALSNVVSTVSITGLALIVAGVVILWQGLKGKTRLQGSLRVLLTATCLGLATSVAAGVFGSLLILNYGLLPLLIAVFGLSIMGLLVAFSMYVAEGARRKGRSYNAFLILSLIFSPLLTWLIIATVQPIPKSASETSGKP